MLRPDSIVKLSIFLKENGKVSPNENGEEEREERPFELIERGGENYISYLIRKNGTKWASVPEKRNVRTWLESIMKLKILDKQKDINWMLESGLLNHLLHGIVIHTKTQMNLKRACCQNNQIKKYATNNGTLSELKVFIGLLYLEERVRANMLNLKNWNIYEEVMDQVSKYFGLPWL